MDGVVCKLPEETRSYTARKLVFPVSGASYMNLFGDNADATSRNLAVGATVTPSVVGAPTVNAYSATMTSGSHYVNTGILQPDDFTLISTGKPVADSSNAAFISNAGSGGVGVALFGNMVTAGDSLMRLSFGVAENAAGVSTGNTLSQSADVNYSRLPSTFIASYDSATKVRKVRDMEGGVVTTGSAASNAAFKNTGGFIVGGAYNTSYPQPVEVYFAAIFPFVFTDDQAAAAYAWIKDFYNYIDGIAV